MNYADSILVSDFDGTMTAEDFYILAVERLLAPEALRPWDEYRAGKISHFVALQRIFCEIKAPDETIFQILRDMRADPRLAQCVSDLERAGWNIIVASAGCGWYIDRILDDANVAIEVNANPGTYHPGGPLEMREPVGSRFYSPSTGIDKAGIVAFHLQRGATVAYAGDGYTDVDAALLVPEHRRFAKAALAESLGERGEKYRSFTIWSDIAEELLRQKD